MCEVKLLRNTDLETDVLLPGISSFLKMCSSSSRTLFIGCRMWASVVILFPVYYSKLFLFSSSLEPGASSARSLTGGGDMGALTVGLLGTQLFIYPHPHSHISCTQLHSLFQILIPNKIMNENQLHAGSWTVADDSLFPITLASLSS